MSGQVVTRFAPSPTGFLHIGGARTALFNWLYAKHTGGRMLLRIEDTDRARSSDDAVEAIKSGLAWMGLHWDDDPISQFQRADRHREIANELLARGAAYKCYTTPEELEAMRDAAREAGKQPRYDGRWRDRDEAEAPEGVDPVIRIKAPTDGATIVGDHVQGDVSFPNVDLDDFVILRSDGTPTYMLAVVVDDHDMGVTHVIRGDDHLTNAARQQVIYEAMGWTVPEMAHIPLIHGPDGAKLSKRHGALGVEAYRDMGYLPSALRNYLARLGWSHGDDEIMSDAQMIEWFNLPDINKGAARFDFQKLEALNGHYMRSAATEELIDALKELSAQADSLTDFGRALRDDTLRARIEAAIPALAERAKTLVELAESTGFITSQRPIALNDKAQQQLADDATRARLNLVFETLNSLDDWTAESTDAALRALAEVRELKVGKVMQPIRAALTGGLPSPGVIDLMSILGREETLGRISDALQ
ncbi:MAG: glutamate--tRNA ligase [Pseudomonadota bacterium]